MRNLRKILKRRGSEGAKKTRGFGALLISLMMASALMISGGTMVMADSSGPNYPDHGGHSSQYNNASNPAWSNAGSINGDDNVYASVALGQSESSYSQWVYGHYYFFNVPSNATITGIEVQIGRYAVTSDTIQDVEVRLLNQSSEFVVANKADTAAFWPNSEGTAIYGGDGDLWGAAWTPAIINDDLFGAGLVCRNSGADIQTANVDYISITVYYTTEVAPVMSSHPGDESIVYGETASFTAAAADGTPTPSIHWQENTGSGFVGITDGGIYSGATSNTLVLTKAPVSYTGYLYRAVFTNTEGNVNSNSATLTVTPKPVTVKAVNTSKIFGALYDPPLTYTVTPALVAGDSFTGTLIRAPGGWVNTYPILRGTLTPGPNYDVTFVQGKFTIYTQNPQQTQIPVATATLLPPVPTTTTPVTTTPPAATVTPPETPGTTVINMTNPGPAPTTNPKPAQQYVTMPGGTSLPPTTPASPGGNNMPALYAIGGGSLLVLFLILFLGLRRSKNE
jgi:hypothetical protein